MLSARQRLLAVALAALGVLAWWKNQGGPPPVPEEGGQERRPDYTVDNFTATMMDESGTPFRRLTARELLHYPDDDSNELQRPRLTLFEEEGPPWRVRSQFAWVSGDNNLILLQGAVFIDREEGVQTRPIHLRTSELLLKRREDYAQTDRPLRITSRRDWTTADSGGRIWFGEELRIELQGRVRGEMWSP